MSPSVVLVEEMKLLMMTPTSSVKRKKKRESIFQKEEKSKHLILQKTNLSCDGAGYKTVLHNVRAFAVERVERGNCVGWERKITL